MKYITFVMAAVGMFFTTKLVVELFIDGHFLLGFVFLGVLGIAGGRMLVKGSEG